MPKANINYHHHTEEIANILVRNFGVKVIISGDACPATDGKTIFLPNLDKIPDQQRDVYLGLLLHETGHIKYPYPKAKKNEKIFKSTAHAILMNSLEDWRIEKKIEKIYFGANDLFKKVYDWAKSFDTEEKPDLTKLDQIQLENFKIHNIGCKIFSEYRWKDPYSLEDISKDDWNKIKHLVRLPKSSYDSLQLADEIITTLGYQTDIEIENCQHNHNRLKEKLQELSDKQENLVSKRQNVIDTSSKKSTLDKLQKIKETLDEQISEIEKSFPKWKNSLKTQEKLSKQIENLTKKLTKVKTEEQKKKLKERLQKTREKLEEEKKKFDELQKDIDKGQKLAKDRTRCSENIKRILESIPEVKKLDILIRKSQNETRKKQKEININDKNLKDFGNAIVEEVLKNEKAKELLRIITETIWKNIIYDENGNIRHIPLTTDFDVCVEAERFNYERNQKVKQLQSEIKETQSILSRSLKSKTKRRFKHGLDEGYLDPNSLLRYKMNGETNVFSQIETFKDRKLAIMILIDSSGSMGSENKIKEARELGLVLSETFNNLKIKHAITSFSTAGINIIKLPGHTAQIQQLNAEAADWRTISKRVNSMSRFNRTSERLIHFVHKSFKEKDNSGIMSLRPIGANVDGESVLWAAKMLADQKEERKLLIVISDGQPSSMTSDKNILADDLRNTVKLVEACGIQVLSCSIGGDHCKHFYTEWAQFGNKFRKEATKKISEFIIKKNNLKSKVTSKDIKMLANKKLR